MLKMFAKSVDFTTDNTVSRDLTTLEGQVNTFVKDPKVLPQALRFEMQLVGATQWVFVLLDYNIKTN